MNNEVADEESTRLGLGRLKQPCDHGEDEIKARLAARAPPMEYSRVSLDSDTSSLDRNRCAPFEQLRDVLSDHGGHDVQSGLRDITIFGRRQQVEEDSSDPLE